MIDKNFCMSSYLCFRYLIDENINFCKGLTNSRKKLLTHEEKIEVKTACDIDYYLKKQFERIKNKKLGILLSGGMDSAILASYMPNCDAYTFRFEKGDYQKEELERAKKYAEQYSLKLHYVDINWEVVEKNIDFLMERKGSPVHSIEPQIYQAAIQAKKDGVELLVIGDAADYVFGGMNGLLSKDWEYNEFIKRYTYLDPKLVLKNPVDMSFVYEEYKIGDEIKFQDFLHKYCDEESYNSYDNAIKSANMEYIDPYESFELGEELNLERIRNGESKYLIRELFKIRYPSIAIPEKLPMPRPVDKYFENWEGPKRPEFIENLDMSQFTGNHKWQLWCLERFLNKINRN